MSNINTVTISGRLTRDPELRYLNNGNAVANFAVAVNGWNGTEETVSYFDCTCFGKRAEAVAQHRHQGDAVIVNGRLSQNRWEADGQKRSRIEIVADQVEFGARKQPDEGE